MARSGTAEKHRDSQAGLAAAVVPLVAAAWARSLDPHDLKGSRSRLVVAIQAILRQYGRAAAAAGLTYYRNERRAAGVAGQVPRLPMPALPTADEIGAAVDRAIHDLFGEWSPDAIPPTSSTPTTPTAPASTSSVADTATVDRAPELVTPEDVQHAEDALTSEVEQLVLDQSRRAVMDAAELDKEATGWARVTEPDACSFCRLLATRGAAYTSKASADFRAHTKKANGSGGTCRCHAEPVFGQYEPTAQARQDLEDYQRLADEYGHSGRDILVAWRQHVEGRPVTGPRTKPYTRNH